MKIRKKRKLPQPNPPLNSQWLHVGEPPAPDPVTWHWGLNPLDRKLGIYLMRQFLRRNGQVIKGDYAPKQLPSEVANQGFYQ